MNPRSDRPLSGSDRGLKTVSCRPLSLLIWPRTFASFEMRPREQKIVLPDNDDRPDVIKGVAFLLPQLGQGDAMTDLEAKLERFETLAAECELIAKLATDGARRELYLRLSLRYRELTADMRSVIATKDAA
jgi:hypothetical protein